MTALSEHFTREEFACHCGCGFGLGDGEVSVALVRLLEKVRAQLGGRPIKVVSGCRCPKHNRAVDGAEGSQHLRGTAADIRIEGLDTAALAQAVKALLPGRGGIGQYANWVHVDVRLGCSRWTG